MDKERRGNGKEGTWEGVGQTKPTSNLTQKGEGVKSAKEKAWEGIAKA